jgi:hypothetical protein
MQDRGDLHSCPGTGASSSNTASIEASCNAAIPNKFLTDILANARWFRSHRARMTQQPLFPSFQGTAQAPRLLCQGRLLSSAAWDWAK